MYIAYVPLLRPKKNEKNTIISILSLLAEYGEKTVKKKTRENRSKNKIMKIESCMGDHPNATVNVWPAFDYVDASKNII